MARAIEEAVVSILRNPRLRGVNFSYGPLRVYPQGYAAIANAIENGSIRIEQADGNASFRANPEDGATEVMSLGSEIAVQGSRGRLVCVRNLATTGHATIVHEATHALQDFQQISARNAGFRGISEQSDRARMAEGAAYVAGWMAAYFFGHADLQDDVAARCQSIMDNRGAETRETRTLPSHAFARWIAEQLIARNFVYQVPQLAVSALNRRVLIGTPENYEFEGL